MMLPASHVIEKCGGIAKTALYARRHRSRVTRWTTPKEQGGTGGLIPTEAQADLIVNARAHGIFLTPADFFDPALFVDDAPIDPQEDAA